MALIIVLQNVSNLADVSDYNYEVLVGDGSKARSKRIDYGQVKGHTRADGWVKLVERMLAEERKKES